MAIRTVRGGIFFEQPLKKLRAHIKIKIGQKNLFIFKVYHKICVFGYFYFDESSFFL